MKRKFLALILVLAVGALIVVCGKSADNQGKNEIQQTENKDEAAKGERNIYKEMGLVYYIPKELAEKEDSIQSVRPTVVIPANKL